MAPLGGAQAPLLAAAADADYGAADAGPVDDSVGSIGPAAPPACSDDDDGAGSSTSWSSDALLQAAESMLDDAEPLVSDAEGCVAAPAGDQTDSASWISAEGVVLEAPLPDPAPDDALKASGTGMGRVATLSLVMTVGLAAVLCTTLSVSLVYPSAAASSLSAASAHGGLLSWVFGLLAGGGAGALPAYELAGSKCAEMPGCSRPADRANLTGNHTVASVMETVMIEAAAPDAYGHCAGRGDYAR